MSPGTPPSRPYSISTTSALACREDLTRLQQGRLVGVFPEGVKGFLKPSDKRCRVERFGRGGFVQIALMTHTPIIPVAVIGGQELHFSLGNSRLLARMVNRLTPLERADSFPLLLNLLPLPVKWRIEFCELIELSTYAVEAARDTLLVQQLTEHVADAYSGKSRWQSETPDLDVLLSDRTK